MRTIKLKAGEMKIPSTASELQIFVGMKGASQAARAISSRLGKAIRSIQTALTNGSRRTISPSDEEIRKALVAAEKMVSEMLSKHSDVGASDTEPRFVTNDTLLEGASFILSGDTKELRKRGWDTGSF